MNTTTKPTVEESAAALVRLGREAVDRSRLYVAQSQSTRGWAVIAEVERLRPEWKNELHLVWFSGKVRRVVGEHAWDGAEGGVMRQVEVEGILGNGARGCLPQEGCVIDALTLEKLHAGWKVRGWLHEESGEVWFIRYHAPEPLADPLEQAAYEDHVFHQMEDA